VGRVRRHWKGLLVSGVVLTVAVVIGAPWIYIHLIEGKQPKALSLNDVPTASTAAGTSTGTASSGASTVAGTWTVASGSAAGYRVHETLAGQSTTAVGRTSAVSGSLTIAGSRLTAASFTVEMATVTSDRSQRDDKFAGPIMDTAKYPTGTFVLSAPIDLKQIPAVGKTVKVTATGKLTLHGTTKVVTFALQAKRLANQIAITGDITIKYGDYNIDNPSFGGFVSVGDSGTIEFLLVTAKKG
jgi:polyisoprenoid-binding protein YceI